MDTKFKTALIERLRAKELTDSTIKMYVRNLERLNGGEPLRNLAFLKRVPDVTAKLDGYKENTKRGYLISIVTALGTDKGSKDKEKLYSLYRSLMLNKDKEIRQQPENADNQMTDTQRANWVPWGDVEDKLKELDNKVRSFGKSKTLTDAQYNTLLSYVVLSLYVYCEPRRNQDYQRMYIIKSEGDIEPRDDENYLVLDKGEFIFNRFKTAKKFGQQRIPISDQLKEVLDVYLKHHPRLKGVKLSAAKELKVYFLVYHDGSPLDSVNAITRILNKVFNKKVGSSMLRHSFLSSKFGSVTDEQKRVAQNMAHSVEQQREYIKTD